MEELELAQKIIESANGRNRKKKNCKLKHVKQWLNLFTDFHNNELKLLKSCIKW
jgi:hypothetical protein